MNMAREHNYLVTTAWTGASEGPTRDYKGFSRTYRQVFGDKLELTGSADPTFLGDASLVNPEELLVAALSSCHMLSYLAWCALEGVQVVAYEDSAEGLMAEQHGAGEFKRVTLHPRVTVAPGTDMAKARALHEKAHDVCFIARSVNFPVEHEAEIQAAG
jgi:organic hydroperoxide reductase OsmC/OhrA